VADLKTRAGTQVKDPLASRVGLRLREARLRGHLTQAQLAGERYTKAYVSALENALVKPSMTALEYLASRLGVTAAQLMADETPAWSRLEADLMAAAGDWQAAADAYRGLLEQASDSGIRAEILRGEAEALVRLGRYAEAASSAGQAVETFESQGREADAALASYWLSAALHFQDNMTEARSILQSVLARVRGGLRVEPGFKLRLLMALASNDLQEGNHAGALTYLEEIRSLADGLDDRRRATYLFDLAQSYRETGDFEGAIRAGSASLALFRSAEARTEMAMMENDLALAYLGAGNLERASELADEARRQIVELGDERALAHVTETQAQIAAAKENWASALDLAREALRLAEGSDNSKAAVSALLTAARAHIGLSQIAMAAEAYRRAADLARALNRPAILRRVLTEWADFAASAGDHRFAFELSREALRS
jgi:tetratricopeptide (TPR) repeat protein